MSTCMFDQKQQKTPKTDETTYHQTISVLLLILDKQVKHGVPLVIVGVTGDATGRFKSRFFVAFPCRPAKAHLFESYSTCIGQSVALSLFHGPSGNL